MFVIKHHINPNDILEYINEGANTFYGYVWFEIDDYIVGEVYDPNIPCDFKPESIIWWKIQLTHILNLNVGESFKGLFCSANRCSLGFTNIDGVRMNITYLRDDKVIWHKEVNLSELLNEIHIFLRDVDKEISSVTP